MICVHMRRETLTGKRSLFIIINLYNAYIFSLSFLAGRVHVKKNHYFTKIETSVRLMYQKWLIQRSVKWLRRLQFALCSYHAT